MDGFADNIPSLVVRMCFLKLLANSWVLYQKFRTGVCQEFFRIGEEILLKMEESFSGESFQLCVNIIFNNMAAAIDRVMKNPNRSVIKFALTEECFQGYCRMSLKV